MLRVKAFVALFMALLLQQLGVCQLSVTIDRDTGVANFQNETDTDIDLDAYQLTSANSLLNPGGWVSLEDQFIAGWSEVANPTASGIAELNPTLTSTIPAGTAGPTIGSIYGSTTAIQDAMLSAGFGVNVEDLALVYGDGTGQVAQASISYIGNQIQNNLVLDVNVGTGQILLENESPFSVDIDFIEIRSEGASLNSAWNGLGDTNTGWQMSPANSSTGLAEFNPLDSLSIAPGATFDLGSAFVVGGAEDLEFAFHRVGDQVGFTGVVEYIAAVGNSGDFDGNGIYECDDIDALTQEIAAGTNNPQFDLTGDNAVNRDDLTEWRAEAGAVNLASGAPFPAGDANLDGTVDVSDFNLWNGSKFTNIAAWCSGDFDANGAVDVSDFNVWNANKFTSADTVAVPEPGSAALLLIGVFAILRARAAA